MPELRPFAALRYDASVVPDLSAVLCPPYDVISATERAELVARDPRNAVNVELPIAGSGATFPYEAAAHTFADWIANGTLRRDDRPMLYVYEQLYQAADGRTAAARGFFCRLRLEPYGPTSGVLPHEHTMSGPKEDRFQLLSAVKANLSPVLFLFDDGAHGATADGLMTSLTAAAPEMEAVGPGGLVNRLWLADPAESAAAAALLRLAGRRPVSIADGHHRYETALRYRDEIGGGSSDQVLALMYEAHSGGLALLPWHRLLSGVDGAALLSAAADWFAVEPVATPSDLVSQLAADDSAIGLWTRAGGALLSVDRERVAELLAAGTSETLRWLDVSVLSSTLSQMIGTPVADLAAQGRLSYLSESSAAISLVDGGMADAAFLLRATPIEDVLAVAASGEHMPAKSTYFHPKAATGIVFNTLAD